MRVLVFAAFSLWLAASAMAQASPSEAEQRMACMGDAVRLCAVDIPDRQRVRACMAAEHDQLSASCRVVFDASVKAETDAQAVKP